MIVCVCVCTRHAQNKEIYKVAKIDLNSSRKICFTVLLRQDCRRVDQLSRRKCNWDFLFCCLGGDTICSFFFFFYYYYFSRVCLVQGDRGKINASLIDNTRENPNFLSLLFFILSFVETLVLVGDEKCRLRKGGMIDKVNTSVGERG